MWKYLKKQSLAEGRRPVTAFVMPFKKRLSGNSGLSIGLDRELINITPV